ncbi:CU044_5270 family protein [Cryptosporangium arvum]|uniref:Uncharacterized protein n=1 Tax=Cryptosporangium arvum DSM 44712 TaxID=927661 RepID=A0A010ZS78_9ACTN|nr:CU044_5270 family protein [Cryptosporangium arvum]EXG81529.1 hypothetical protein CryarDRAFT_2645 [Cryptosporangium arvum DSM 44712]
MSTSPQDPSPLPEALLPAADARRGALLREFDRAPGRTAGRRRRVLVPALAAGALAATVALTGVVTQVVDRNDTAPTTGSPAVRPAAPVLRDPDLDAVLARADEVGRRYRNPGFGPADYIYTQSRVRTPSGALVTQEEWFPVDGDGPVVTTRGGTTTESPSGARKPSGPVFTLPVIAADPTYYRLGGGVGIAENGPLALIAEIRKATAKQGDDSDAAVFARLRRMLRVGGHMDGQVRTWLYHAAALVPGVRYDRDEADVAGRRGVALTLTADGKRQRIVLDPTTGALLSQAGSDDEAAPAILRSGLTHEVGGPLVVYRPEPRRSVPDVSLPKESWDPAASVRDLDFANLEYELPLNVDDPEKVIAGVDSGSGGPVGKFRDGVALVPPGGKNPLRLTLDPAIVYVRPTAAQVGPDATGGDAAETAVVVLRMTRAGAPTQYAIIAFSGQPGPLFPGPQSIVLIVTGGPGPVVSASGDTLSVAERPGAPVRRSVRNGVGFEPKP